MRTVLCLGFYISVVTAAAIFDQTDLEKVYLVGKRGIQVIDFNKLRRSLFPFPFQFPFINVANRRGPTLQQPPQPPQGRQGNSINTQGEFCVTRGCVKVAAFIIGNIDEKVDPCDDFYKFACGGYLQRTTIPDSKSTVSILSGISDHLFARMKLVLEREPMSNDSKAAIMAKNLYRSCMNETLNEGLGILPLRQILRNLGGWPVTGSNWNALNYSMIEVLSKISEMGFSTNTLFSFDVAPDDRNSSRRTILLDQPEFGLERDFLISGINDSVVQAYLEYSVSMALLLGASENTVQKDMKDVLLFEIQLANISTPKEERRNYTELYNVISLKQLQEMVPEVAWLDFMQKIFPESVKITMDERVDVVDIHFFEKFAHLINNTSSRTIANYLLWRALQEAAPYSSEEVTELEYEFYKVLEGESEPSPRWSECVSLVQDFLPFAMGNLYIKNYFEEEAKTKTMMMVQYLRNSFEDILRSVDWMDEATKARALEKSRSIQAKIAYPDEILMDSKLEEYYGDLTVDDKSLLGNIMRISAFWTRNAYSQLHEQVDKNDWKLVGVVAEVNAYYYSNANSIIFPAGILQGILFDPTFPQYVNFAGIGMVIGHEITHAFDDSGKQFDAKGNLNNWWEPATEHKFTEKAQCIIDQYSSYVVPEIGVKLNGINSQSEDIADNGGTKESYRAYQKWVMDNGPELPLPGMSYNTNQLFWISLAQKQCERARPEYLRQQIMTDEHTPKRFRLIGPLQNSPEFANDFNCPSGSNMNPTHKCAVW